MDKITLNEEQLKKLVTFIGSRGFKDPIVVMDILDHFSCKVEELMSAQPALSLEAAIQQAHNSFGIKGFLPLAEASRGALIKKCAAIYRAAQLNILTSVSGLVIVFGVALLFFYGYHWAASTNHVVSFMDCNLFTFIGYLVALASVVWLGVEFQPYNGLHQLVNAAGMRSDRWLLIGMVFIAFIIPQVFTSMSLGLLAALRTIVCVYVLLLQWSKYNTIKKVIRTFKVDMSALRVLMTA